MTNSVKTLKKRIRDLEALLNAARKSATLGLWEWNLKPGGIKFSKEAMEIICLDMSMFDGTPEYIAAHVIHEEFKGVFEGALKTALEKNEITQLEYRLNCGDQIKWVRVEGEFLFNDDGTPEKVLGVIQDISSLKQYEETVKTDEEFLDTLLDTIKNPIFYKDAKGYYQFCNSAFSEYLGIPKSRIIGARVHEIAPSDLAKVYHEADMELMDKMMHQVYEAKVMFADGTLRDVVFNKSVHKDYKGNVLGLVGVMLDITRQNEIKKQIDDMNRLKEALIEINQNIVSYADIKSMFQDLLIALVKTISAAEGGCIFEVEGSGEVQFLSCYHMSHVALNTTEGKLGRGTYQAFFPPEKNCAVIIRQGQTRSHGQGFDMFKMESGQRSKSKLLIPITYSDKLSYILSLDSPDPNAFRDSDLALADYILKQVPIMYQVYTLYQKTLYLSQYDTLTNLMNRHHFATVFRDRLQVAEREGRVLLLAVFDLDGLKDVNDTYGHKAGDAYIIAFAKFVKSAFRRADRVARTGGDEFAALFFDTDQEELRRKLVRLQTSFAQKDIIYERYIFRGGFSFGIASYPSEARGMNDLEKLADRRMYKNKNLKRQ